LCSDCVHLFGGGARCHLGHAHLRTRLVELPSDWDGLSALFGSRPAISTSWPVVNTCLPAVATRVRARRVRRHVGSIVVHTARLARRGDRVDLTARLAHRRRVSGCRAPAIGPVHAVRAHLSPIAALLSGRR
jgi:hypothetical protein